MIVDRSAAAAAFAFLCSALSGSAGAQTAPGAPAAPGSGAAFTVQDLVRLDRPSEVAASPDGKRVAFTLRTTDLAANRGRTAIWLLDARKRGAAPVRFTDLAANSSSAEWTADGRALYFLSNRGGSTQVWRREVRSDDGPAADAIEVTRLPLDVGSFRVSAGGDRLVFSLEVYTDCADLECSVTRAAAPAPSAGRGVLYDKLFVRHWDSWSDGRRSQLYSLPLDASGVAVGTPARLTLGIDGDVPGKPFGGREDYAQSPDGRRVAFSVRPGNAGEPWSTNFDIHLLDTTTGGPPVDVTLENPAWDGQPAFSPDGSLLAYVAQDRPGFEADRFHLVLLDLKSGVQRPLTRGWDRSIASFAWAPDGRTIFATTDHLGQRPLWAIDAATGRPSAITGDGDVESFSVGSHQVFYTQSSLGAPADLYAVGFGGGKAVQLTHLNQAALARRKLGDYEQFSFAGWKDENVFGYVVKPPDLKKDRKYPVALVIHGGPQGSLANLWHWRWNAQTFAGAGYGVVMIDFHGSTGYGQAFTDSISGDWGGKPLDDLKRGLAAALKQFPWLDGERVCALGGSYGGYMVNWIAGQWQDRFRCIVSHDGIFDNRGMYYSTDELWFNEWEMGGPEYANPAGHARQNPVDHVAKWKTPTLVIQGQQDFRVPVEQGLAVFTALQRLGVPSEFLYFPDENHWVLKPANSIQWYDTVIAWMDRWTRAPEP